MHNSEFYKNIPFTFSRIKLHAPTKVILEFYKSNKAKGDNLYTLQYNAYSSLMSP